MTQSPAGGSAQTVYRVTNRAHVVGRDAQRVFVVADGRPTEGGPQQAVYYVSDAEIAAGDFIVTGNKPIPIVEVGAAGAEYPPIAVYVVTANSPSDILPTPPPASALQFDSAEIGAVNAFTLDATFNQDVSASDYSDGVTIKVNGTATSITSATRQANHAIVRYVIPVLWHGSGDAVTWEYSEAGGGIVAESDSTPLGDVTAQSVTNNCGYAALLDLQVDTLALADNDPVSLWPDQSANSHDFTQVTENARPLYYATGLGAPYVSGDGIDDWMISDDFAGSVPLAFLSLDRAILVTKISNDGCSNPCKGWVYTGGNIALYSSISDYIGQGVLGAESGSIFTTDVLSLSEIHCYIDGVLSDDSPGGGGVNGGGATDISNAEPVRLMIDGDAGICDSYNGSGYRVLMIHQIIDLINWPANRAALETRLAARYGITL